VTGKGHARHTVVIDQVAGHPVAVAPSGASLPDAPCAEGLPPSAFSDCNPHPSQTAFPECYQYEIAPARDEHGECVAGEVTVTVSGWPSILDAVRADVIRDAKHPDRIELRLNRVESSVLRSALGADASFRSRRHAELNWGPSF
jgi:hypothetical protein